MKLPSILAPALVVALCTHAAAREVDYGNDALPSAEGIAFQTMDARLGYARARIAYDARACVFYEGVAPDGRLRRKALRNERGQPLCVRRR